jgi:undecaprenyl-diphosphatase
MNQTIFVFLNSFVGRSLIFDTIIVFFAEYLVFALFFTLLAYEGWRWFRGEKGSARRLLWSMMIAGGVWLIVQIIKRLIYSPRPFLVLEDAMVLIRHGGYDSFPSGHTAFFFALGTALFLYFNRRLGIFFMIAAILVGLARVSAGIHWPIDILGGIVFGFLVTIGITKLLKIVANSSQKYYIFKQ